MGNLHVDVVVLGNFQGRSKKYRVFNQEDSMEEPVGFCYGLWVDSGEKVLCTRDRLQ